MLLYIKIFGKTDEKVIIEQRKIFIIDQDRPLLPTVLGKGIPFRIIAVKLLFMF